MSLTSSQSTHKICWHNKIMVNANSHTHGIVDAPSWRPKSKQWKRKNKSKLRGTAIALQDDLKAALAKGNE